MQSRRPRWREKSNCVQYYRSLLRRALATQPRPPPVRWQEANSSFYSILPTSTPRTSTFFVLNRSSGLSPATHLPPSRHPPKDGLYPVAFCMFEDKVQGVYRGLVQKIREAPTDPLAVRTCSRKAGTSHKASSFSPLPPVPSPRLYKGKTFDKRDCEN